MYANQLGRRNLTDEKKTVLLGKMYSARKRSHGGDRGNQYTKVASDQSGHLATGRIKEQIAKEYGVGQGTVQRAEIYANGIDAIREEDPELADEILTSRKKVKKSGAAYIPLSGKRRESDLQDITAIYPEQSYENRKNREMHFRENHQKIL